jgi:hypothetical protein
MQIKPWKMQEIYDGRSRGKQRDPWQKMETGDERPKENTGISMETQEIRRKYRETEMADTERSMENTREFKENTGDSY